MAKPPFARVHSESIQRKMDQPKGLDGMLTWFLIGWREEMPDKIHSAGVWRDRGTVQETADGYQPVGGSLLGAPQLDYGFRSLVESSPFRLEAAEYEGSKARSGDESYTYPMRAALATLAGRHSCTARERLFGHHRCGEGAAMARLLTKIAFRDGDWEAAADEERIPRDWAKPAVMEALHRLWRVYRTQPPQAYEMGVATAAAAV